MTVSNEELAKFMFQFDIEFETLRRYCYEASMGRQPWDTREIERRIGMTRDKLRGMLMCPETA